MSEYVHQDNRGDCYQRMGDSTLKLSFAQRQELEWDRGASRFESTSVPGGGSFEEVLDPEKVEEFRALLTSSTPQLALQARDLLTRKGEVTVAAALLFAQRPQIFYPNAHVRILRYDDNDRGAGRRQNLVHGGDIRAEGSIPEQLSAAIEAIEQLMPKRQALGDAGRFVPHAIVPKDAWLEELVNALVHRSYSMGGDHIRVEIFPNRIEITNPGRFLGLNRIDNPEQISRNARNPRIARVCADLGIAQELGEGIRRIFQEMRTSGLVDPVYEQVNESVKLTLHASNAIPADLTRDLGRAALEILKVLRQSQKQLGTGEITELVSLARPTVLRHLKALHSRGLVVWHKQSPNDPRATWSLE
ncbi:ArsR family transcriptional regulator [Corynebacterium propinquum]|uniref:ATP-binding protein n=1 Tax=Corynebacterium propinquum TaxID=43769 RepID=UPI00266F1318|nr:ATP-binding protein [Corynebacterium propinquum]WKS27223.1 ArsR family transcriptional regulator [Corynebacterium propinquum]